MRHLNWRSGGQSILPAKNLPHRRAVQFLITALFSNQKASLTINHDNTHGYTMKIFLFVLLLVVPPAVLHAQSGYIEVSAPGNRQLKLAVDSPRLLDLPSNSESANLVSDVIAFDMNMSGLVVAESRSQQPVAKAL